MADRVFSYEFRGKFDNLRAGLAAGSKSVSDFGGKLTALDRQGAKMRQGLDTLGRGAGRVGLLAAGGLAAIVAVTANFDQAMSKVAATGEDAKNSLDALRQAAVDAGAATAFSASEAAGGIENLLKAGVSTKDVLGGGLAGALDLAAAGGLEVADAAEIAATALTQFKLSGEDVPHVADLLAAGAGKAQGDVSDLSMALKQSGLVASQMGVSIEETTGTLAAFASAGLLGSDAGTSFRTMLLRLANPTKESGDLMKSLGINAYDASGKFVGMASVAEQLKTAFEGKTQAERDSALATIFGSDAIRAASVLYEQGGAGVDKWTANVDDAGYAAEVAGTRLDNLKGDLEALKGSLETALIGSGEGSTGVFRELAQGATALTNAFNGLPGPTKTALSGLLAVTAVIGGGAWFGSKVINGISDTREALKALGIEAGSTSTKLRGVGLAAGAVVLAFGYLNDSNSILDSMGRSGDAAKATAKDVQSLADALGDSNVGKYASDLGIDVARLAEDLYANGESGEYASKVMQQLAEDSHGFGAALNSAAGTVLPFYTAGADKAYNANKDLGAIIEGNTSLLGAGAAASDDAASASKGFSAAVDAATTSAKEEAKALQDNIKAMRDKRDATLGAFDAETQYRQALKDAQAQGKKNSAGIRGNTDAALANRGALSDLAGAWNNQSDAVKNNNAKFREARKAFVDTAEAMGVPKRKAEELADSLLEIPKQKVIKIEARAEAAKAAIEETQRKLDLMRDATVWINVMRRGDVGPAFTGSADGSTVPKTGRAYADRHPYLLADGEEVISNRHGQADRHRGLLKAINAGRLADGGTAGRPPMFTGEGPEFYHAAYRHNKPFALDGPSHWDWPYQTPLSKGLAAAFEKWVAREGVPFDPTARIVDYDMRGFFKKTRGRGWHQGSHFPDTYKTPYDTTFSHESKYATVDNPFYWRGDKLVDVRNGRVIFAADGATVPKTGMGYADRHPYMLADGEEVISNRYGQADRHRGLLKSINAGRLALGGTAGGSAVGATYARGADSDAAGGLRALTKELKAAEKAVAAETKQRDALVAKRDAVSSGITGGLTRDLFASTSTAWGGGAAMDPTGQAQAMKRDAQEFTRLVRTLKRKGLDGAALAEVLSTGDIERARMLASWPAKDLQAFERAYNGAQAAVQAASNAGGQATYGAAVAQQTKELQGARQELREIKAELKQAEKHADKSRNNAADRAAKHGQRGAAKGARNRPNG